MYSGNRVPFPLAGSEAALSSSQKKDAERKPYSQTYRKTMYNTLSTIFNHACRFYNLKSNPARQAGNMGKEEYKEMLFWTTEEYKKFSEAVIDKPVSFYEYPFRYRSLVRFAELEERAAEVNETAYELLDDIENSWLKKHKPKNSSSFTEQLQLRTQARMMAEEIVIADVVMQFH